MNEIDFAVRVDQQGNLMRDFHIAQKYKTSGEFERSYVTNRYYLEDAIFVVAISHADDEFMTTIEKGCVTSIFNHLWGVVLVLYQLILYWEQVLKMLLILCIPWSGKQMNGI